MDVEMGSAGDANDTGFCSNKQEEEEEDFKIIFDNESANIPVVRSAENHEKYVGCFDRAPAPQLVNDDALPQTQNAPQYHDDISLNMMVLDVQTALLPNKIWRNPEADLSDYFNYGHNEYSWWILSKYKHPILYPESGKGVKHIGGHEFGIPQNLGSPFVLMIFCLDIDGMILKPWLLPGADLSHFFNYGHDPDSWREHCEWARQLFLSFASIPTIAIQ